VFPGKIAYGALKGAIEPMTRYLAAQLAPRGITVNTLAPGATATDFSGGLIRDNPDYRRQAAAITALGRPAEPDDIGRVIASLLADDRGWINGERIEASGGMKL
jgi:NAD(P)-dependent dehydrogenase (short-subunit alcohol dehydrogenase family)